MRAYAIGVDLGGTKLSAGLVDRKGRIIRDCITSTPKDSPFAIVDNIIDVIQQMCEGIHPSELVGVGLGLPAQIDWHKQTVEFCTNLPLAGVAVRDMVKEKVNMPVTIDNDAEVSAIGEARFGAAQGCTDFLMVTMGTGIGGGLWLDGKPYRGSRGLGGELGHILVEFDGKPCPCGGFGHLEAYVSRNALIRDARAAAETYRGAAIKRLANDDLDQITDNTVLAAAKEGDAAAQEILDQQSRIFGRAMVGMVNLLDPQLIVVGGGLGQKTPIWVEAADREIRAEALAGRVDVKVVPAHFGMESGLVGAAAMAFDEYDFWEDQGR